MPRTEIDYSKNVNYKIVCNDITIKELYVGHTTQFTSRKNKHKSDCTNPDSKYYDYQIYSFIRNNGGWSNWTMIEIEKFPCNDNNEATRRERYWYEKLKATLNKNVPNRNLKEWKKEHSAHVKKYNDTYGKIYRDLNREKLNEDAGMKVLCACGKHYTIRHKIRHEKSGKHQKYINSL